MKNGAKTEKQVNRKGKLQEILGDDYWAKEFDVSVSELKKIKDIGISALIIEAGHKHKSFVL